MSKDNFWRIPISIVLTVLAIFLLVSGAETAVIHSIFSVDTVTTVLKPLGLNVTDLFGSSYEDTLADMFNGGILALAQSEASAQGYQGDISATYGNVLSAEDVKACISSRQFKKMVSGGLAQYAKSWLSADESAITASELMQNRCMSKLQKRINDNLSALNGEMNITVSEEDMEGILNRALDSFGLDDALTIGNIEKLQDVLKTPAKWLIEKILNRFMRSSALSIVMIAGGCICIAIVLCLRYREVLRAVMYAVVTLTVAAAIFCVEGFLLSKGASLISLIDLSVLGISVDISAVTDYIGWCISLIGDLFFKEALWFLVGTIPFRALEIWYYLD